MLEYKVRSAIKLRKFKDLLDGEVDDLQHQWDSDEDLADHKFELNEQFDLYNFLIFSILVTQDAQENI
jgi:hypothetical protein